MLDEAKPPRRFDNGPIAIPMFNKSERSARRLKGYWVGSFLENTLERLHRTKIQ